VSRISVILRLAGLDAWRLIRGQRMMVMFPLILLFITGACWGFADPRIELPGNIPTDDPAVVLYLASAFVLFSSTLGVVLLGFDAVSRRRMTGELAIDFCQPMRRDDLALAQLLGVWAAACAPTAIATGLGIIAIHSQMGEMPAVADIAVFTLATGLLLWWYTNLQMLASSWARDLGSSVSLGVGTWMLFTMIWLLVTAIVATTMGVDATDTSSAAFDAVSERVDLFSPNGLYQLLLETRLPGDAAPSVSGGLLAMSTAVWTLGPTVAFLSRMRSIRP